MADLNEVRLIGRLTRDVEVRNTPNSSVASFGIATSRKYKDKEDTTFVDITAFGKLAEICSQYLAKGSQVFVGGRLKFDSWEDRNTGAKRSKLSVIAENVQFLSPKNSNSSSNSSENGNYWGQRQGTLNGHGYNDPPLDEPPF